MIALPTEAEPVVVVEADCLDVLPTLDPAAVAAVVTDPPYGIAYRNRRSDIRPRKFAPVIAGDESSQIGQQVIGACRAMGWPVCAFAHHRRPWVGEWRQFLVWDKGGAVGGGGDRATCWKFTWELIQVAGFGPLGGKRDEGVVRWPVGQCSFRDHPTQKPVGLMRYLIRKLTRPGDLILDPFAGSGTTGVAAAAEGRRCLLIEKEPAYAAVARRRVAEAAGVPLCP